MTNQGVMPNEPLRLLALQRHGLLDSLPEEDYDRITFLTASICQAPIALITLVDEHRLWFKSRHGIDVSESPRQATYCDCAITNPHHLLVVEDATKDERFADNPVRYSLPFYAGMPLTDVDGFTIGTLCVFDSAPRTLTAEQQASLQALAKQVERLIDLRKAYADLSLARQLAEEQAKEKGRLLATLSHEIRTPIQGMVGIAHQLRETSPREDQLEQIATLQTAGQHLSGLVNSILDYSKLKAGRLQLELLPFSLSALLSQCIQLHTARARDKELVLRLEMDANMPDRVLGDTIRLMQILHNLLGNAVKFTVRGEVILRARQLRVTETHTIVQIEVVDTGVGIPEQAVATLFDEYTQVANAATRTGEGTGLGLSISCQLLELMGSRLQVRSELGVGSTFWFTLSLPLAPGEHNITAKPTKPEQRWAGIRILAVDDYPLNTTFLAFTLRSLGIDVTVYNDPLQALAEADQQQYNLIFLDLQMPHLNGYQLAEALRPIQAGVPIIALSAENSAETEAQIKEAGFAGFMAKPFSPNQLEQLLKTWLPDK